MFEWPQFQYVTGTWYPAVNPLQIVVVKNYYALVFQVIQIHRFYIDRVQEEQGEWQFKLYAHGCECLLPFLFWFCLQFVCYYFYWCGCNSFDK